MPHVSALSPKHLVPDRQEGWVAAWRRRWRQRQSEAGAVGPSAQATFWTSGVTYRGYLGIDRDVSNLWISEEQLRETQALLRVAAAAGRLGAWAVELQHMHWVWSEEVKAIHEVDPDYAPNTEDALAFYAEASQDKVVQAFDACAKHGTPFDLELELKTAKGRQVWIRAIGEPERNAEGRITHVRGAIQDVSSAHAVMQEVQRTADRFTRTLEGLSDGFMLLDHEWCFVYLNPEAERILRRSRKDLLGRCLLTEFPETAGGRFLQKCQDAISDGNTVEFEKFYQPLGIWVYMKVQPTDQGLNLCIRDDTERINARREVLRLKAQLEGAHRQDPAQVTPQRRKADAP